MEGLFVVLVAIASVFIAIACIPSKKKNDNKNQHGTSGHRSKFPNYLKKSKTEKTQPEKTLTLREISTREPENMKKKKKSDSSVKEHPAKPKEKSKEEEFKFDDLEFENLQEDKAPGTDLSSDKDDHANPLLDKKVQRKLSELTKKQRNTTTTSTKATEKEEKVVLSVTIYGNEKKRKPKTSKRDSVRGKISEKTGKKDDDGSRASDKSAYM